jgi:hypothetical protein
MMARNKEELLNMLQFELGYMELGGYEPAPEDPREELSIFVDSPSCLNYGNVARKHPCSECWLVEFVPQDKRGEPVPCHHIPLTENGETVADMAAKDRSAAQQALRGWLRATIKRLESEGAASGL